MHYENKRNEIETNIFRKKLPIIKEKNKKLIFLISRQFNY